MAEVPVKIEKGGTWVTTKIDINDDRMVLPDPFGVEIPYKNIIDLEERKSIIIVTIKGSPDVSYRIASVEKVLTALKIRIIKACNAYRIMAYFMSPAIRGGVLVTNANWEKGFIAVMRTGIWFASQAKQVCVPLKEVASIELTKREVQKKQTDVVKIEHLEDKDVVTSFVLCPISTLQVLYNYLRDATKENEMKGDELDPVSAQVAMLIYSGMDTHSIEGMLNLPHKDLDAILDKLLGLGLAEVMLVRRELQLTPKGVRYISEAIKPST